MMMIGIGDVTHDPSVYLLKNTDVLAAIESERLSRIKHGLTPDPSKYNFLEQGLDFKKTQLSLEMREKSHIENIRYCFSALNPKALNPKTTGSKISGSKIIENVFISSLFSDPIFSKASSYRDELLQVSKKITLINISHHMVHAASSFYTSPFESSAILAIDGYGYMNSSEFADSVLFAQGKKNQLFALETIQGTPQQTPEEKSLNIDPGHMIFSNSLGVFYQNITLLLGLGYFNEGKTMGLSAYGKKNLAYQGIQDWIQFLPDGTLKINNREIFLLVQKWIKNIHQNYQNQPEKKFQAFADLAFTHQNLLEKMIFHLCHGLYQRTGETRLCLTGGVALNSVANGKILANTPFKEIHIIPPTGDNGIALGAALYGAYHELNYPRTPLKEFSAYLGKTYSNLEIKKTIQPYLTRKISGEKSKNLPQHKIQPIHNPQNLSSTALAAKYISEGKIIAWFSGGSEIGPRALGNRSILADPRSKTMRDYLNLQVKHREFFRPFAPACLAEDFEKYFLPQKIATKISNKNLCTRTGLETGFERNSERNTEEKLSLGGTPFMLEIREASALALEEIPAVIHVDQTARVQIVNPRTNPIFYQLIQEFKKITRIGILLNTSFNGSHEPIIETPEQAIECFLTHSIDVLFLNGEGWMKTTNSSCTF
jgi:carbamoyltransferase